MVGAAGLAAACGSRQPAGSPSAPAAAPAPSGPGLGFVLSDEQFTTAQLVDQAQAAEQAGFRPNPLDKVIHGWTTGTDATAHIAAVQAVLDAGATPFMHFPQQNPHAARQVSSARR